FVIDNFTELQMLNQIAGEKGQKANVLFRVTPGVEAHTHEYISTGQTDSKFGFDIGNGQAAQAVELTKGLTNIDVLGIHSHIGSQIFEVEGFRMAAQRVGQFASEISHRFGVTFRVINLGGGFGIRYKEGDTPLPI